MYDIKEIKAVPIADVARKYGMELEQKHGRLWGKMRNEKTASFSINLSKNLWYDFGAGRGGSVIDLVMEIEGVDRTVAINKLAEQFGLKNEVVKGWTPLTDTQYRLLGIEPERATINFNYDLRVHTIEQLARWNEKYGMPLRELVEKNVEAYNKLVSKIGQDTINADRDSYFIKVKLSTDLSIDAKQREIYKLWATQDMEEINKKVDLLQRAYKGNYSFNNLKVDIVKDYRQAEAQRRNEPRQLSEDELIRDKIIKVYKSLYNFEQADYLTIEHAKALQEINKALSNSDNKYLAIKEIRELYKSLGNNLQNFEAMYSSVLKEGENIPKDPHNPQFKEWTTRADNLKGDISNVKELFSKCSTAIEGVREACVAYKNDMIKQTTPEKAIQISGPELS